MKRIMTLLLGFMLAMPLLAQNRGYRMHYPPRRTTPVVVHRNYGGSYRSYGNTYRSSYRNGWDIDSYYGIRVGLALASVISDDDYLDGSDLTAGVNVGVVAGFQMSLSAPIYFETGLNYIEKGGRGNYGGSKFTYDLNYLQVPLLLKYDYRSSSDFAVQPFAGGYVAAGVGGQIKDFGQHRAMSSFDDNFFRRFDGGIRIGCGIECSHVYAEVAYDLGLSNICHDTFNTSSTGCLLLNCGVNF